MTRNLRRSWRHVTPLAAVALFAGLPAMAETPVVPPAPPTLPAPRLLVVSPQPDTVTPSPRTKEHQVLMPAAGVYTIRINNVRGRVVLRPWNKNLIYVQATTLATHPLGKSELPLFNTATVAIAHPVAEEVVITTDWPGQKKGPVLTTKTQHIAMDYIVAIPNGSTVEVRQEYGDIVAHGIEGRLDLFTRDGAATITGVKGRVDVGNERGPLRFRDIEGDVIAHSANGDIGLRHVHGDVRAVTTTGDVRIEVSPRFAGEVSFHTVSGQFRSDLGTFQTDLAPGDKGYVGVLRGPLANLDAPELRYRIDTTSGTATIASERSSALK